MIGDNHFYGHDRILKGYCGVSKAWPIPGRLQHGWTPGPGFSKHLFDEPWPKFVWSRRNLNQCWEQGRRGVVPIGSPFLYLPPPPAHHGEAMLPKSLLVYPFHGYEHSVERLGAAFRAALPSRHSAIAIEVLVTQLVLINT